MIIINLQILSLDVHKKLIPHGALCGLIHHTIQSAFSHAQEEVFQVGMWGIITRTVMNFSAPISSGNATRSCGSDGQWGEVNALNCISPELLELEAQLVSSVEVIHVALQLVSLIIILKLNDKFMIILKDENILNNLEPEQQITAANDVTEQLVQFTEPQNKSLLPNNLGASARILTAVVNVLENNNVTNEVLLPSSLKLHNDCIVIHRM